MKPGFQFGNLRNERSKIILLPSFQLVTRLNWKNRNETSLLMNSDTLNCIWILAFPIGIIQVSTPRKWSFLHFISSLHDYWPPITLISLEHNSVEMEWCEKRAFQLLKMRKMKESWNKKTECVTDFLLTVRTSSMKDYTCHYAVSTQKTKVCINFIKINVNLEIFCLLVTGYLNTEESFPICMFL